MRSRMESPSKDYSVVPVPMKFLSTWEIERTSPECVPRSDISRVFRAEWSLLRLIHCRWCRLKMSGLAVVRPEDLNLQGVIVAVSMKVH